MRPAARHRQGEDRRQGVRRQRRELRQGRRRGDHGGRLSRRRQSDDRQDPDRPEGRARQLRRMFDIFSAAEADASSRILTILVIYVTMVYGPIAAALVEFFPTRIRYTGLSLPYHIGNGWFGGLSAGHLVRHGGADRRHLLRSLVSDRRRADDRRDRSTSSCRRPTSGTSSSSSPSLEVASGRTGAQSAPAMA